MGTNQPVTKPLLQKLAATEEAWCVSLLIPTHPSDREIWQAPIRLKNLLRRAEMMLVSRGIRAAKAREILAPAAARVGDTLFWTRQDAGLALYFWPGECRELRVPAQFDERVVVNDRPWIIPLLPLITDDTRFFILALSGESVRLIEASRYAAVDRELPEAPQGMEDLTRFIEAEKQLQFHTRAAPADNRGMRAAVFHGHGVAKDEHKVRQREYCQWIDNDVCRVLAQERAPLVLAAEVSLAARYREVCSYRYVLDKIIAGNPDALRPAELGQRAWKLVEPGMQQSHRRALDLYHQAAAQGQGTDRLEDILRAGSQGRLNTLMVDRSAERWGRFDPQAGSLELHGQPKPGDHELVNLAVVLALGQGADVFPWPADEMPTCEPLAALLRY